MAYRTVPAYFLRVKVRVRVSWIVVPRVEHVEANSKRMLENDKLGLSLALGLDLHGCIVYVGSD